MKKLEPLLTRLIEFGLLTEEEEKTVYNSLLNIEKSLNPKTQYIEFIDEFNKITGKKYKPDIESRTIFYENEGIYSLNDRLNALKNALVHPWIIDNITIVTPAYILKPENTSKYMNYVPAKNKSNNGKSDNETAPQRKSVV
jgi:hypothetical protein